MLVYAQSVEVVVGRAGLFLCVCYKLALVRCLLSFVLASVFVGGVFVVVVVVVGGGGGGGVIVAVVVVVQFTWCA